MADDDKLVRGGAHRVLLDDQIKWVSNPNNPGERVLYLNFDTVLTREEVFKVFEEHFGICRDWQIPKRDSD